MCASVPVSWSLHVRQHFGASFSALSGPSAPVQRDHDSFSIVRAIAAPSHRPDWRQFRALAGVVPALRSVVRANPFRLRCHKRHVTHAPFSPIAHRAICRTRPVRIARRQRKRRAMCRRHPPRLRIASSSYTCAINSAYVSASQNALYVPSGVRERAGADREAVATAGCAHVPA